jgi:glycosyltransferase involved in cell wall biosynthesis
MTDKKLQILLEMRPALDGFAGIPQETRLLFRELCTMPAVEVQGLLQTSMHFLNADVVASLDAQPPSNRFAIVDLYIRRRRVALGMALAALLMPRYKAIKTVYFESCNFASFIWQRLFVKTLPAADFALVTARNYRVCSVPWNVMQSAGLYGSKLLRRRTYPMLDTTGIDIFITQTPYPGRLSSETKMVVRYHDALPILMPLAFANAARHHATHLQALRSNVDSGAYFACVSEATRQDLLHMFPQLANRAVTIHNMVSLEYFDEESAAETVLHIVLSRLNKQTPQTQPSFASLEENESFYLQHLSVPFKYLLMVSTIEPRKNHLRLLSAWETIRAHQDPCLKLIIVGSLGWDVTNILEPMRNELDRGALFLLSGVPAAELRVLYRHAAVTVCPSLAEGFDYTGVEAMRSSGVVIASDIAVHREVYANAAEYFDPTCVASLVHSIKTVLYDPSALHKQSTLRSTGKLISERYLPNAILPKWEMFLQKLPKIKL